MPKKIFKLPRPKKKLTEFDLIEVNSKIETTINNKLVIALINHKSVSTTYYSHTNKVEDSYTVHIHEVGNRDNYKVITWHEGEDMKNYFKFKKVLTTHNTKE